MTLLDLILLVPAAGFLVALFLPKDKPALVRNFALIVALVTFALSLLLIGPVNADPGSMAFEQNAQWIASPAIRYHVGVDGLSLWLVILSTLLTPIASWFPGTPFSSARRSSTPSCCCCEVGVVGVFVALDLFLFYVFWEVCWCPMYFLIGIWGHDRRIYAAVKFFLYTMAGSVLMLAAIICLYNQSRHIRYAAMLMNMLGHGPTGVSATMRRRLAVPGLLRRLRHQGPAVPAAHLAARRARGGAHRRLRHAGLRDAETRHLRHRALSACRCSPTRPSHAAPWIVILALIGIVYGALVAMVQPNMKKLVAYSSVSHLGFVVLGIFSFTQLGLDGAVYQMLNHGVSTGALFILVGFLYERRHSLEIADYGGVATVAPVALDGLRRHHAGQHRTAPVGQLRRRVSGPAGRRRGQLPVGRFRRAGRHSLRRLHAVACAADLLWRHAGTGAPSHAAT